MVNQQLGTNTFTTAKWIVSATASQGTHTTIASALTSASSGDTIFILPGTYTENLTLKAGVNLSAFDCDALTPNVTILGKCTFTAAGTVTISGIQLKTNSDFLLAITGSSASIVNLQNCYVNALNNTAISYTSSSASSQVNLYNCLGDIGTTGISCFTATGAGVMNIRGCTFTNSGSSTTASTNSSATISFFTSLIEFPITTSSVGSYTADHCSFNTFTNTTQLTTAGTGGSTLQFTEFQSGTASAISIGSGTAVSAFNCNINSTNTNAIAGSGSFTYSELSFNNTSNQLQSTLSLTLRGQTPSNATSGQLLASTGAFTSPSYKSFSINTQTFTSSGTYTPTSGMLYCIIECVGGGAGGGGTANSGVTVWVTGGGGGGGAYSRKFASAATIGASQTVTVGASAAGGAAGNNAGTAGNATSVGTICTANGGSAGAGNSGATNAAGGAGGTAGTGDFSIPGQAGVNGISTPALSIIFPQGGGGSSCLGFGGSPVVSTSNSTGNAGQNYGGGGSGGVSFNASGTAAGGAGAAGFVIITEFIIS